MTELKTLKDMERYDLKALVDVGELRAAAEKWIKAIMVTGEVCDSKEQAKGAIWMLKELFDLKEDS